LVSHGVNLSLGSGDPLNMDYLLELKRLLDEFDVPWWSDHLCFASNSELYFNDLLPLPWSHEAVNHVCERIKRAQDYIGRPLLVENITYYMQMPGRQMHEAQFISEVLERADCGMLLDLNNVFVNSVNHRFDPYEFLSAIPLDRVVQIHMAGHSGGSD